MFWILLPALSGRMHAAGAPAGGDAADQLFQSARVLRVRIEVPPEGMEVLRQYVFRKGSNPEERPNVAATVHEGGRTFTNVAMHLKGSLGSFVPVDEKPALTLNFDKWADGQRFHGLQKISLNNSVQDPSYVSEALSRELFRAAGLPCPRTTHARVELNGRDLGLYVLVEGWNKQFLKRHFPDVRGNLWDSGSAGDINEALDTNSGDDPEDRLPLDVLIAVSRDTNSTHRLERLGQVLDLERFYPFMAMEVMLAHWDGYCLNKNNYRVFEDRSTGRLVFLPSGLDQVFGVFRMTPTASITPMMKSIAARAVMGTAEGRRRYLDCLGQMITNLYDVARLTNRVAELAAPVRDALEEESREQQQAATQRLVDRIVRRGASVREQITRAYTPLQFGPGGEVLLSDWRLSRDSGSPSFRRGTGTAPTLEIGASGGRAYGSWRTVVFLDRGDYALTGRLKLVDAQYSQSVTNGGATVRISGEREARMVTNAADWTTTTYTFSLPDPLDVEIVCEFRASQGRAVFDASSLKLIRQQAK